VFDFGKQVDFPRMKSFHTLFFLYNYAAGQFPRGEIIMHYGHCFFYIIMQASQFPRGEIIMHYGHC